MTVMSHIYILYKVTGYVERPDYKHFNEYSKEKKYGTKYNVENHRKVLQTWKEDLRDKKYNNDRKHQNISIDKLSALEAIEEYVVLHGKKQLKTAVKAVDVEKAVAKAKEKIDADGDENKCEQNARYDMELFTETYENYSKLISDGSPKNTKKRRIDPQTPAQNNDSKHAEALKSIGKELQQITGHLKKSELKENEDTSNVPNTRNLSKIPQDSIMSVILHFSKEQRETIDENKQLIRENAILKHENEKLTKDKNNLNRQIVRANKRFQDVTGKKYKKKKLKAKVKPRQIRNRDTEAKKLVEQCGSGDQKYKEFLFRQFKSMYIHNKEFRDKVNKITLPNIVVLLNKGIKDLETDPAQVELYFVLNICAHNSIHNQYTMRIGVWEKYYDKKKSKWRQRRRKDPNGVLISYGVSPNQFRDMMKNVLIKYPSFIYARPDPDIWHLTNPVACFITYVQEWMQNDKLKEIFPYHEDHLKIQYAEELKLLEEDETLTIKIDAPINNELQIDAFPIAGCIFSVASHFLWVPYELFTKPPPPMLSIIAAFTTVSDKSEKTTTTLDILEPYHKLMEKGVTIPSLNLPIEILLYVETFIGGDGVFMAWIRGCANHNFMYGKLYNVRLVKNSVFELSDENDIDINDDTDDNKDDEKKKDMDTDNDIDSSYETESETNVFDGTVLKTHNSRKRKQLKNVEDDVINITESDDDDDVDEEIDVNML
eukprot:94280_1